MSRNIQWPFDNRRLIGGLEFVGEPEVLRFFYGRLKPVSDWQQNLAAKSRQISATASEAEAADCRAPAELFAGA